MKAILFLLFIGLTSATLQEKLQDEAKKAVSSFVKGIQSATPLHVAIGVEFNKEVERLERDIKEELKKHIEDAFEKALKKIEDAIKNKKEVNKKALKMLKDLKEKMKDLNIQDDELTEKLEVLKGKIDDHLRNILQKMGIFDKRSSDDAEMPELFQGVIGDRFKEVLSKLKKWILEKLDVTSVKEALGKIIEQATQKLCEWLTTKGKQRVLDYFNRFYESDTEAEAERKKRMSEDRYQEIRNYLDNMEENANDKLKKFKKWLHDLLDKGIEEAKEKVQNVMQIMKEIIAESKKLSKKGLYDILEHVRAFEDQYGSLYDLRKVIEEVLKRKD